jgi:hypothetical protein
MTPADLKRHPLSVAFDVFRREHAHVFDGPADDRYLSNRLETAFQQGWLACERAVKKAMDGRSDPC